MGKDGIVVDDGTHEQLLAKKDSEPNVWKTLWQTMKGEDPASASASSPSSSVQQSSQPPQGSQLPQGSSSTTAGKFAVLRSALASSLPKEKADAMIRLVNELEQGGTSDE